MALAIPKRILIDNSGPLVTFCRDRGWHDELIFKTENSIPKLIRIRENSYQIDSLPIFKGENISRDYTISVKGQIAFVSGDKLVISWPEKSLKNTIDNRTISENPAWSPDGSKMVYCCKGQLICYDLNSTTKSIFSSGERIRDPIWPLSDKIFYIKNDQVMAFDLKTNNEEFITTPGIYQRLTFDYNNNILYIQSWVKKVKGTAVGYNGILEYNPSTGQLNSIIGGYYRFFGVCQRGQKLCMVDIKNQNQLFVYDLKTKKKLILEEKNALDGITTYSGNAVLYETFDKLYLYWF
jgi:Tol biopolymer transport system component